MRLLYLALGMILFGSVFTHAAESTTIICTARADGRLENCRCPKDPNGALEKRLPEINRYRELGPVLLLDAGGFLPQIHDTLAIPYILNAFAYHNYDAVTVGMQELRFGPEWVHKIDKSLPVVSANVRYQDGTPVGQPVRVIERGGETYAITGITTRKALEILGPEIYEQFTLLDVTTALQQAFANVPDDARRIILVQAPMEEIRERADLWDGIDLVVGGHNSDLIEGAEFLGKTAYMQVGSKGRYLGLVKFKGDRVKADLVPVQKHLPDDPRIVELALELRKERMRNRPPIEP